MLVLSAGGDETARVARKHAIYLMDTFEIISARIYVRAQDVGPAAAR